MYCLSRCFKSREEMLTVFASRTEEMFFFFFSSYLCLRLGWKFNCLVCLMSVCQYRIYKMIRIFLFKWIKKFKKEIWPSVALKSNSHLDTNSLLVWEIFQTKFVSYTLSFLFGTDILYPMNVTQEILINMEPRLQVSWKDLYNLKWRDILF